MPPPWSGTSAAKTRVLLAVSAGLSIVFSYVPFYVLPLIVLYPLFLNLLIAKCQTTKQALIYGLLVSFIINAGGFWWIVYTIHVFGFLPYWISTIIFLAFCALCALNVPVFMVVTHWFEKHRTPKEMSTRFLALWLTVCVPALFVLPEYFVPKLFPVYYGHAFAITPLISQISEVTGTIFLTFLVMSTGGLLTTLVVGRFHPIALGVPLALWIVTLGFGWMRYSEPPPPSKKLNVAFIQANIGSLDKLAARGGLREKIKISLDTFIRLTDQAMERKPDLIIWPETAVPVELSLDGPFQDVVRQAVLRWNVPLITGGYAHHATNPQSSYNAAYLLSPENGQIRREIYYKNILLAFGEYFPFGEEFPKLYDWFPAVSNFSRGSEHTTFRLADGTRLGITVCYEAIVPDFFRGAARATPGNEMPQAMVNLTNDSWFGPTTEPAHHGQLAAFRAIETRLPLLRATNTGMTFAVDRMGKMGPTTKVYEPGILVQEIEIPVAPRETFYLKAGNWFIALCALIVAAFVPFFFRRRAHVSLPG